jgi:hypothetical protein
MTIVGGDARDHDVEFDKHRAASGLLAATRPLSKFELDCRDKAQARQKQALASGQPQVLHLRICPVVGSA